MHALLRILVGLGVLVGLALAVLAWRIDAVAERLVEEQGSRALGVSTGVAFARVGFLPPGVRLSELSIANPPGFGSGPFLALDHLALATDLGSLVTETVVVPRLEASGVEISLERTLTQSNYGKILDQLRRGAPPAPEPDDGGRRLRVDEIVVRDVTARVRLGVGSVSARELEVRIPEIRLRGTGEGAARSVAAQVARALVVGVLERVAREDALPVELAADLRGSLRGLAASSLGDGESLTESAREAARDAGRTLRERLRGGRPD
jgi:hypothetical protein